MRFRRYHTPGTAPGTLASGDPEPAAVHLRLVSYTQTDFDDSVLASLAECPLPDETEALLWLQLNGRPGADLLRDLGQRFGLHDLALEDVLNTGQRPKAEIYGEHLFLVLGLPVIREGRLQVLQVSLFAGPGFLICFFPQAEDPFEPIRHRARPPNNSLLRSRGVDYLLYAMIDLIVDSAFPVLEQTGDLIETLEELLLERPDRNTLADIHRLRRELLLLRHTLWPQREVVATLMRGDMALIEDRTGLYLRDCYDHAVQVLELQESYREMTASLLEVYLSSISHHTNEVMRVLTIIATIFIPLTFIVGIYGMNFSHEGSPWAMPELYWYYGYPIVWGVMLAVVVGLLCYFRHRKWL